jgi:hypothetical protein
VDRTVSRERTYELTESAREDVVSQFPETGYGYVGYEAGSDYGISIVSRDGMEQLVRQTGTWHEAVFIDRGWDGHQDAYALRRS